MSRRMFQVGTLENTIEIAAAAEEIFNLVADVRNEPRWNPQLLDVQMLAPEPMGVGSRFLVTFGRGVGEALIEDTRVDRPSSWTAVSRSRVLDAQTEGRIDEVPGGSRLTVRTRLSPHGILRLLTPVLGVWMRRSWDQDLRRVKASLEQNPLADPWPEAKDDGFLDRVPVPDLCALWAESTTAPMNIALIGIVEGATLTGPGGAVAIDRIRSFLQVRLPRAPMLLRTLRPTRIGQGPPAWIDTPRFDIAEHVLLAPADQPLLNHEDFLNWCARRSVIPLDRSRPLWRLDVVPGLRGGDVGLVLVLHHVVADGLRGVALLTALLDSTPTDGASQGAWRPKPAPTGMDLVRDNLRRRWDVVRRFRPSRLRRSARTLRALSRAAGGPAPSTSLTGPIGRERQLAVLKYPVLQLRAAAHTHGCTINDLLIAAVTAGLRDLLRSRGECRDGLVLRASVPVGAQQGSAGGMFIASLPVGVPDKAERLQIIRQATSAGQGRPNQGVAGIVALPPSLARLGAAWAKRRATTHINLYVTNVPGPTSALCLAGARLLEAVPLAPLVAGVKLSVTALSYNGQFAVSLLVDDSIPDLSVLVGGVRTTFEGYLDESGSDSGT